MSAISRGSRSLQLYWHTLRWLRARQIRFQLTRRIRGLLERPGMRSRGSPAPDPGPRWDPGGTFFAPGGTFFAPGGQRNPAAALRTGRFTFLNRTEPLGWPPRWENAELPRLWQYNLHYFEYLWALPYEDGRELVLDWIARHGPGRRRLGWEPYPTSLRCENWCAYFFGRHRARIEEDVALRAGLSASLHRQLEWLARHLEYHLLGNHLLENAGALAFCGACLAGDRAATWRAKGLELLGEELREQILADGVHFERSPMYQARVVYLLALLAGAGDPALAQAVESQLARARGALAHLCHPDGEIALLNDSAFGIANHPSEIGATPGPEGPFALADAGYYGARSGDGHYVVCDAAPIGPDHLPGHGHGDIFSFELSLAWRRVVVDAGVYGYEPDEMRRLCRSTRAHNTVEVDGEDQSEFWASFRVARRGRPHDVHWKEIEGGFRLEGWHDGYQRLPARARHERRFRWHPSGVLLARDRVVATRVTTACSRLHLHPSCEIVEVKGAAVRLASAGAPVTVAFRGPGELSVEGSYHCPEFGRRIPSQVLVYRTRAREVETGFCIARGENVEKFDLASGASIDGGYYGW